MRCASRCALLAFLAVIAAGCKGSTKPVSPGNGNGNGKPGAGQTIAVAITPAQAQVSPGGRTTFAATVTGTANTSVLWSVVEGGGGTVGSDGTYTAPASTGTFHVLATSAADATKSATAAVTVAAAQSVMITVSPGSPSVNACKTLSFTATVTGTTDTAVTWAVQEGASGGTITSTGTATATYTAPSGPGTVHVVATSHADGTKQAVALVTVNEVILGVTVSPATVTVAPGGTQKFTATVTNTCGSFTTTSTLLSNGTIVAN